MNLAAGSVWPRLASNGSEECRKEAIALRFAAESRGFSDAWWTLGRFGVVDRGKNRSAVTASRLKESHTALRESRGTILGPPHAHVERINRRLIVRNSARSVKNNPK